MLCGISLGVGSGKRGRTKEIATRVGEDAGLLFEKVCHSFLCESRPRHC